jgi:hypothetical protein
MRDAQTAHGRNVLNRGICRTNQNNQGAVRFSAETALCFGGRKVSDSLDKDIGK